MSAETLRAAAKVLREKPLTTFGEELADWLEATAERQKPSDPRWGGRSHSWSGSKQANAVANAILRKVTK